MPSSTTLTYEWVTDARRFLELRTQWNLFSSSAVRTVFLTHAWLATWVEELSPDTELHVLTAWQADRLVGAFPLFGDRAVHRGRMWEIMGTGTLTPNHLDIIAEPAVLEQVRARFVEMLLERSADWDVLELDKIPADSKTAEALRASFVDAGLATTCAVSAICPYCDLPETYEAYIASLKRQVRKDVRQARRWLAENPEARRLELAETPEEALRAMESLERFHQARWQARGYPGAFADPRVVRFHHAMLLAGIETDMLRMYTLTEGDEIVAVSYNYRIGPFVEGYLSSFDVRWADASPGVLLRAHVMEECIAEKASRFDFLEGTEHYKKAWCTGERENLKLRVFSHTLRGRMAQARLAAGEATVRLVRRVVSPELREQAVKARARRRTPRQG